MHEVLAKSQISMARGIDASCLYDNRHWCPGHWRKHHRVLVDVVQQYGEPDIFLTIAPWEWSFPFPEWIRKAHSVLKKGPTDLPGPETLAIAHALHQVCAGLVAGGTGKGAQGRWRSHVFANKSDPKVPGTKAYFARFEFQDKGVEQEFGKGRGSPHVHMLLWLDKERLPDLLAHQSI
eukprot:3460180-Pyramimonas_sp.AAC.1